MLKLLALPLLVLGLASELSTDDNTVAPDRGVFIDKDMNEPNDCDVAIVDRLVSGYCSAGVGSYQTLYWCLGHHKTAHTTGPEWTPVPQFAEGSCPKGEVVSDVRLRIRTRVFKVGP